MIDQQSQSGSRDVRRLSIPLVVAGTVKLKDCCCLVSQGNSQLRPSVLLWIRRESYPSLVGTVDDAAEKQLPVAVTVVRKPDPDRAAAKKLIESDVDRSLRNVGDRSANFKGNAATQHLDANFAESGQFRTS